MERFAGEGMRQQNLVGMQGKAARQLRKLMTIQKITAYGAAHVCHVHTDLMGAPRFQL